MMETMNQQIVDGLQSMNKHIIVERDIKEMDTLGNIELNKIYCCDCYQKIKDIPDKSIDLVYIDIPYMIVNGGKGAGLLKSKARNELYEKTIGKFSNDIDYSILDQLCRVMKYIYIYMV